MKTNPDESTCYFASGVLLKHIQALQLEIEGVRLAQDIEYIHRMRVATRRLRSALSVFSICFPVRKLKYWTRQIQNITRALGNARDADVQIDLITRVSANLPNPNILPGLKRLFLRLSQHRESLQAKVLLAVDELTGSGLLADMTSVFEKYLAKFPESLPYSTALYRLSDHSLNLRLNEFLAFEPFINFPDRVTELHAMRIAAKRLRYEMEIFAPLYPEELKPYLQVIRKNQETLGNIHDCDMWAITLPQFMDKERKRIQEFYGNQQPFSPLVPGIKYFAENRLIFRQQEYEIFLQDWQKWKTRRGWEEFLSVARRPLTIVDHIFPVSAFVAVRDVQDLP